MTELPFMVYAELTRLSQKQAAKEPQFLE
ncbi:MAG: hypothetical protein JWP25_2079, partial [Bradyrhizobium sp.]|nr:hypothetical protein [Bradyrhizobium sp.]